MKTLLAFLLITSTAAAQQKPHPQPDPLLQGFQQPPQSARPLVWWHWMNGNISKEGIRADLEWMHRIGIGGVQVFDAALATPQIVPHRIEYMTPEWKDDFRYATTLCDQLGLDLSIAGSPGWSETGGPWVTAPEAMKKYVWSETNVEGGKPFTGTLQHPPTVTGRYQFTPILNPPIVEPEYYADAAVIAFRTPTDDIATTAPQITTSDGADANAAVVSDENLATSVSIRSTVSAPKPWIQASFPQSLTIRSITLSLGQNEHDPPIHVELQASNDGVHFRSISTYSLSGAVAETLSFSVVTARLFRLICDDGGTPGNTVAVNEFAFHTDSRVNRFEAKAGFQLVPDLYGFSTPAADQANVIAKSDVIDLTDKLRADGTLLWTPPPGRWTILRIGYSLLGTTNHPATKEATGLEVDKLNRHDVKDYMDGYLKSYRDTVGPGMMGSRGIRSVVTDSWEAGSQNWTANILTQFRQRRGYDPTPWLPVLAGHIVGSSKESDEFLWDYRRTLADLVADEHYGQVQASLASRHMGHYGESHESGRAFIGDGMEVKKLDDVPMGAMWTQTIGVYSDIYRFNADDRESASVAHIYGQNLAAAESMTAKYDAFAWSPSTLKPTVDQEFLNGINRIAIHESSHQPLMNWMPGLTLGKYGQWFNRNETWADQARPWIDYLARSSYMLQQGRFTADILYFYGEDSNLTAIFRDSAPSIPSGYNFDYINADGLIHAISVEGRRLVTQSGMRYHLLALDPYSRHMSLPVLRALDALVRAGATLAGPKPLDTPSLADDASEFARLSNELFGSGSGTHIVGKGTVYAGSDAAEALRSLDVPPDFWVLPAQPDTQVRFIHRTTANAEIYFVDNRSDHSVSSTAAFRVTGKIPELWHPETGMVEPLSYEITQTETTVPLHLEAWGSAFVVFRHHATNDSLTLPTKTITQLITLQGPWSVSFQPGRGAPDSTVLPELTSWSTSSLPGIKFYSGRGTYTKTVIAPSHWFVPGVRIWLDLGDVKNLASVTLNGKSLGTVWHAPYRVDVTSALVRGTNNFQITVTNAWVNRLIGDQQPHTTTFTHVDIYPYRADSPLLTSGLLGPVKLSFVSDTSDGAAALQ